MASGPLTPDRPREAGHDSRRKAIRWVGRNRPDDDDGREIRRRGRPVDRPRHGRRHGLERRQRRNPRSAEGSRTLDERPGWRASARRRRRQIGHLDDIDLQLSHIERLFVHTRFRPGHSKRSATASATVDRRRQISRPTLINRAYPAFSIVPNCRSNRPRACGCQPHRQMGPPLFIGVARRDPAMLVEPGQRLAL